MHQEDTMTWRHIFIRRVQGEGHHRQNCWPAVSLLHAGGIDITDMLCYTKPIFTFLERLIND